MPELPEVENARQVVEKALHRVITDVDDRDEFECRPHLPGDIAGALKGGQLVAAHRRGKAMWCDTVDADGNAGPALGIHLGMGGRIIVTAPDGESTSRYGGGDPHVGERETDKPEWTRFSLTFEDGGQLRLFDKRRLGRVRLDPDVDALGPDAAEVGREEFRSRIQASTAPIKARLLDQSVVAGIGNLLADEVLWRASISPSRRSKTLDDDTVDELRVVLRRAIRSAIAKGGVHTGEIIPFRKADATCPRCGAPMSRGTVGGRTTWWCSNEQA
ncbi:DNA-formamidopyrimidine glycosylase family protein [Rhodococcus kroppenstedtii]|uniref:Formamidopyrimidine-DNA glycosylase n=1 Tax=Rhodococcoides kroppenstedtii TaxID=293050 RepID=A0A1I0UAV6_9NOCA|nr:DNA-formamidopyrimidine glycosylase family protein [Rhodococcus kroppenstedtii]MBT1193187.1 formamidopyrimidine-DNA glycosylase [Rhodococcus kroppenstedtii]MBY6438040.1 formamidopyrimidine-DNA glycosylase [Rhodococcus kroppenstedtii]MDV7199532.1 DNA-formamidopyrimidine glycosylase family protein [Rhodococcus kroppenstedtii]SFA61050.1 formamidopyrimidine-DNA glycosylase [Rhodococcus kroppenstedtii]